MNNLIRAMNSALAMTEQALEKPKIEHCSRCDAEDFSPNVEAFELSVGVKMFVEKTGRSLNDAYTAEEIAKLVQGQYGAEQFAKKAGEAV